MYLSKKRLLVSALDRGVTRNVLATVGNLYARRLVAGAELKYDGAVWLHKSAGYWIPDGPQFSYTKEVLAYDILRHYSKDVEDFWFFAYTPQPGHTIVDVGAGRGEDLLPMVRGVGGGGLVVAIEAHPTSFEYLSSMVTNNGLANVRAINAAVMDRAGVVKMDESDDWILNKI